MTKPSPYTLENGTQIMFGLCGETDIKGTFIRIWKEPDMYPLTDQDKLDLETRFTYHSPKDTQPERYILLRSMAKQLAIEIATNTPRSREQALALTNLEQSIFWANAAIARNE